MDKVQLLKELYNQVIILLAAIDSQRLIEEISISLDKKRIWDGTPISKINVGSHKQMDKCVTPSVLYKVHKQENTYR